MPVIIFEQLSDSMTKTSARDVVSGTIFVKQVRLCDIDMPYDLKVTAKAIDSLDDFRHLGIPVLVYLGMASSPRTWHILEAVETRRDDRIGTEYGK